MCLVYKKINVPSMLSFASYHPQPGKPLTLTLKSHRLSLHIEIPVSEEPEDTSVLTNLQPCFHMTVFYRFTICNH